jgi:hypothetical protein
LRPDYTEERSYQHVQLLDDEAPFSPEQQPIDDQGHEQDRDGQERDAGGRPQEDVMRVLEQGVVKQIKQHGQQNQRQAELDLPAEAPHLLLALLTVSLSRCGERCRAGLGG